MRVLLTGATGFIGSTLVRRWHERGWEVLILTRDPASARRRLPEITAAFPWDPEHEAPRGDAFDGVEAVVHLAGESVTGRWTSEKKRKIIASRSDGTRNLVAGLRAIEERPRVLVSASAIGFYGDRGDEVLEEDSSPAEDFLARVCRAWEAEAEQAVDLAMRVAIARIGVVLSPQGGALEQMLLPARLGLGGALGSGRQWWSWIHLEDVAGAIELLIEGSLSGPVNLTSPNPVRQKEFAQALGRVLRRPALLPAPAFALRLALGGFASELLASKRVVPSRLAEAGFRFTYPDLEAALRHLISAGAES